MKILIIEAAPVPAGLMKDLLEANNFDTEITDNGEDGIAFAETGIFDLLILDAALPKKNGYEVARQLRAKHCKTPILMISAPSEPEDEIEGLNSGADYYLTKPYTPEKLLACIHALLRRQGAQLNELAFGDISLNLSNSTLYCSSCSVRLSSREFDILRFLLSSPGQILSKEQILCRVWGFDSDAVENHVEVYVAKLRKKLRFIGSTVRIEAIRRLGYLLET